MCGHLDGLKGTKKGEIASRWEGREVAVKCPLCYNGCSGTSWGCAPPTATSRFGYSLAYPARTRRCSGFPGGPDPGPVAGHSASGNVLPRYIRLVADVPDPIAQAGYIPPLLEGTLQGPSIRHPAMAHWQPILAYAAAHTFLFSRRCACQAGIYGDSPNSRFSPKCPQIVSNVYGASFTALFGLDPILYPLRPRIIVTPPSQVRRRAHPSGHPKQAKSTLKTP